MEKSWRHAVVNALETLVQSKHQQYLAEEDNRRRREHLCSMGKQALHELCGSCCCNANSDASVTLTRLRYRTQPTTINNNTMNSKQAGSSSLVIYAEIDLWWRRLHDTVPDAATPLFYMDNVHLSCSSEMESMNETCILTLSGMVPTLRPGDCVTISVIVNVNGITWDGIDDIASKNGLTMSVQILWSHRCGPTDPIVYNGDFLALVRLPPELLIVPQRKLQDAALVSVQDATSTNVKNVSSNNNNRYPPPTLFFECRHPRLILVDVTSCTFSFDEWLNQVNEDLDGTMHCVVGMSSEQSTATLSLVLLAYPSWEFHGLLALVKRQLPAQATIVRVDPP